MIQYSWHKIQMMPKMETLKSLLPFCQLLGSTSGANDCYRLDTWSYICSFWKTIWQHMLSHKNVCNFRSCHPIVVIYFQKRHPCLPSLLTDSQAHYRMHLSPCCFLCLEPCSPRGARGRMPLKPQLRHHHLWEAARGHAPRLAPSPQTTRHTRGGNAHLSWGDARALAEAPPDLWGRVLFDSPWNPGGYFCRDRVLTSFAASGGALAGLGLPWLSFRPAEGLPFRCRHCVEGSVPSCWTLFILGFYSKEEVKKILGRESVCPS